MNDDGEVYHPIGLVYYLRWAKISSSEEKMVFFHKLNLFDGSRLL